MNLLSIKEIKKLQRHPSEKKGWVYFLFKGDELVYIGSTQEGYGRIVKHIRSKKDFDSFAYIEVPLAERLAIEERYIKEYPTKYNHTRNVITLRVFRQGGVLVP